MSVSLKRVKQYQLNFLKWIVDCGMWAPSRANTQCFDFVVINDKKMINKTTKVSLNKAQRLVDFAKGFQAVNKTYLSNTEVIIIFLILKLL